MTHRRMIGGGTLLALLLASAGAAAQGDAAARGAQIQAVTEASAREVAGLIAQPGFAEAVRTTLAASPERGVALDAVMERFDPGVRTQASVSLASNDQQLRQAKGLPAQGEGLLQLRAYVPEGQSLADIAPRQLWVASLPRGNDRDWTTLTAYDARGRAHVLDARQAPAFPVLIVDVDTRRSVQEGMALVNAGLRARGLQSPERLQLSADGARAVGTGRGGGVRGGVRAADRQGGAGDGHGRHALPGP
ncbi:hypothetical protein G6F35_013694 [Rhizopus arrhizus]|nr:hypothetical protein G6F35_013694 [Rhizopus arrhizus]